VNRKKEGILSNTWKWMLSNRPKGKLNYARLLKQKLHEINV
jgi:hypothetical protein